MKKTGERIILETKTDSAEDQVAYHRSIIGYNFIVDNLRNSRNAECLEIGSTEGFGTSKIAEKVRMVIAVDKDKETIEHASAKNKQQNVKFKVADGTNLPFNDESFDLVVSLQVIEHIEDDHKYLQEIKRVLKPKGLFFCSTPNKKNRYIKDKPWNRFHVREYDYQEFKSLFNNYFSRVQPFCISAKGNTAEFEKKRLKKVHLMNRIDFLNLRRFFSPELQSNITENLKTLTYKIKGKTDKKYLLEDFYISQDDFDNCLDLIFVAEK